ncbi:hypothetical protein ACHAWU_003819 [Discostella pseudostelligera]|uniref:SLC26A/SulP transporter domain-containing protein n=1 Tax=Discostella pseudostelligera TaxID=259834 RepID=A0ABD3MWS8_9STRA
MDRYIAANDFDDSFGSSTNTDGTASSGIVVAAPSRGRSNSQRHRSSTSRRNRRSPSTSRHHDDNNTSRGRSLTPRRRLELENTQRNRSPSPTQVMGIPALSCDEENQGKVSSNRSVLAPDTDRIEVGMCFLTDLKSASSWNKNFIWVQLLSGMTVAIHQVPECVSYACIAGVDPFHALQAAWIANIFTPIVGGTPGLVSGPSGLGAIAIRFLVSMHGPESIFYAVMLSGICQVLFGALGFGKYLRLLPTGITIGMVNALCVLLVALQLRYFKLYPAMQAANADVSTDSTEEVTDTYVEPTRYLESTSYNITEDTLNQPWAYFLGYDLPWEATASQVVIVSVEAFAAILICYFFPKYIPIVPSSLMTIFLLMGVNSIIRIVRSDWMAPTVGDYFVWEKPISKTFMGMFYPDYNLPSLLDFNALAAIIPAGLSLFCIHLLETMVAMNVADKYTSVVSEQDRVFYGQGVGNLVSGLMAGMGGTGLAHTSLLGLRMGGVTNLSVFFAGIIMFIILTFMYPAVSFIPLGAFMGISLHLMLTMMQQTPVLALILNCIPCLRRLPQFESKRLVVADLFSTLVTSLFAILASTYGLAGYFVGVVCYACDPIAHGK